MAEHPPLSIEAIQARLDRSLDVEFSFLKTEQPATILAQLEYPRQDYILTWVERVASTNIQLAYQFITQAIDALEQMDQSIAEADALGIDATPTIFINGLKMNGAVPEEQLRMVLDKELQ